MAPVAGEPESDVTILHRRYARAIYGLALRRLHDVDDAEDATQRAFAAIWRDASIDPPARGADPRRVYTVALDAIVAAAPHEVAAESTTDDGWLAFRVHVAVAELPEQERVPLELAYWGGRRPGEIAELLGLPVGTIEMRTRSALRRLSARLEEL